MPIVKVWCLPANESEEKRQFLYRVILNAIMSIEKLGLKSEKDVTCLFPSDLMAYGLGSEIIIEIGGLFPSPERTLEVRQYLAGKVGGRVKELYPGAKVECFVSTFDPAQGFWSSE